MSNRELIQSILSTLEENHLNLYHSVTKKEILEFIDNIDNIDELSDIEFDCQMRKMFSLFKDGHTTFFIPNLYVDKKLIYVGDKVYIKDSNVYKEVTYIGNKKSEDYINELGKLMNYETKEHLKSSIRQGLNNGYFYKMLKADTNDRVSIESIHDEKIEKHELEILNLVQAEEKNLIEPIRYYSFKILEDNILYFKYERCQEDPNYSFSQLINDLQEAKEKYNYKKYILDLRGNGGGNSRILEPFIDFVDKNNLEGALLIDNGVFSSGRIAVAQFREKFNTPIIGEPSGAALKSYGYNNNLKVGDKSFSVSIRFWDFSGPFGYEGAIQPDVYMPLTIDDLKNKKDSQLEMALNVVSGKEKDIKKISKTNK